MVGGIEVELPRRPARRERARREVRVLPQVGVGQHLHGEYARHCLDAGEPALERVEVGGAQLGGDGEPSRGRGDERGLDQCGELFGHRKCGPGDLDGDMPHLVQIECTRVDGADEPQPALVHEAADACLGRRASQSHLAGQRLPGRPAIALERADELLVDLVQFHPHRPSSDRHADRPTTYRMGPERTEKPAKKSVISPL